MSPYFDGCYFDPTYFDAAACVVPEASPSGPSRRFQQPPRVDPRQELEDSWVLGLIDDITLRSGGA